MSLRRRVVIAQEFDLIAWTMSMKEVGERQRMNRLKCSRNVGKTTWKRIRNIRSMFSLKTFGIAIAKARSGWRMCPKISCNGSSIVCTTVSGRGGHSRAKSLAKISSELTFAHFHRGRGGGVDCVQVGRLKNFEHLWHQEPNRRKKVKVFSSLVSRARIEWPFVFVAHWNELFRFRGSIIGIFPQLVRPPRATFPGFTPTLLSWFFEDRYRTDINANLKGGHMRSVTAIEMHSFGDVLEK